MKGFIERSDLLVKNELPWSKVVAIDGPSGAGKSTLAIQLAKDLSFLYIDTGAMFRALAVYLTQKKIDLTDETLIQNELPTIHLEYGKSEKCLVAINNVDLTEKIREHHVSALASTLSKLLVIRNFLVDFQRQLASHHFCVMEGRDIGSVVFPQSFCKIFLTATPEVRGRRRLNQLLEKKSPDHSGDKTQFDLASIIADVTARDEQDSKRAHAPLVQCLDAVLLDTSLLTHDQVLTELKKIVISSALAKNLVLPQTR